MVDLMKRFLFKIRMIRLLAIQERTCSEAQMNRIKSFPSDQRGATAILFGLLLLPLMAAVGAAVDYSRAANARTAMQTAVDAAALLAARDAGGLTTQGLTDRTRQAFLANFNKPGTT